MKGSEEPDVEPEEAVVAGEEEAEAEEEAEEEAEDKAAAGLLELEPLDAV